MKPIFKIKDSAFLAFGSKSSVTGSEPTHFKWSVYQSGEEVDICFLTDACIKDVDFVKAKKKVAWLLDPYKFRPQHYEYVIDNEHKFNHILSYEKSLFKSDKWQYQPMSGTFVNPKKWCMAEKTKICSMIVSKKSVLEGHKERHKIIEKLDLINDERVDVLGSGYGDYIEKIDGTAPYMFQICIQPVFQDDLFTELLIDCFALGTIPIYKGTPNIGDYFSADGIITFNTHDELKAILKSLSRTEYIKRRRAAMTNHRIATSYQYAENYMWRNNSNVFSLKA